MVQNLVNEELENYIISMRRHFHENPELSFQEKETFVRLKEELEKMGLKVTEAPNGGLYADITGGGKGRTVALRADVDALPVTEENTFKFVSRNKGVMHACGHDAHMAMLLGVAKMLLANRNELKGTFRLMFQAAEEKPPGGAISLIKAGVLRDVDYVIGQHVMTRSQTGTIASFPKEAMAYADEFRVKIHGKGGHGSAPQETIDALVIATQYVNAAQTIVSRMTGPFDPSVVTFGTLNSGYRYNIIAAHAEMTGTVRTFDRNVQKKIRGELEKILAGICSSFGAHYDFEYIEGYPALINHESVTKVIEEAATEVLGKGRIIHPNPDMGGEDFAYYVKEKPGSFYFLGVGNSDKGIDSPQHSPTYTVDESALKNGTEIFYRAAVKLAGMQGHL